MSFFAELRERRLFQIVATFAAAGWVMLEVVNSLIERGILPEIVYRIGFVWYIGGLVASVVIGWYHGEKGRQRASPLELGMLAAITAVTLFLTGSHLTEHVRQTRIAEARQVGAPLSRVAVLYFRNSFAPDSSTYLGDALTEALIEQLQDVEELQVVSANAVLPFRGSDVPPDSIGSLLGVGTVVDGMVDQTRDGVRINVRLLEGTSGVEMARTTLERPRDRVLEAPNAVAREVAELFRQRLGEEVRLREVAAGTESQDAWRALQRAEKLRKDAEAMEGVEGSVVAALFQQADSLLEMAEQLDPEWTEPPLVRAQLALDFVQQVRTAQERSEGVSRGVRHANRVLELEPDHPRALAVRGTLRLFAHLAHLAHDAQEHQALLHEARNDLERAVRLDRDLANAHATLSVLYYQPGVGDLPQAALAARQAYEADAYLRTADDVLERLFWTNLDLGQFAQARRWCEEGGQRFPRDLRFVGCRLWLMTSPGASPDIDAGWEVQEELVEVSPEAVRAIEDVRGRMLMAAALGRAAEDAGSDARRELLSDSARNVLERAHADYVVLDAPHRELFAVEAFAWVILDDFDRAIERWQIYASLNHGFQQSGDISWRWRELREHPRFQEVVTQGSSH